MRVANILVFDEYLQSGSSPSRTKDSLNQVLGSFDQLAIMAVADNVNGAGAGFKVQVEHSADGRSWLPKSGGTLASPGAAEIGVTSGITLTATSQMGYFGSDGGTTPNLGHVRLKVDLGASTSAHVRVYVTGRNLGGH